MTQTPAGRVLIFADSNVFVEALFVENSCAAIIMQMVVAQEYGLATCAAVLKDVERAISHKTRHSQEAAEEALKRWSVMVERTKLVVIDDASPEEVRATFTTYIATMRHRNDIPILAAALRRKPDFIISNNREHFNDAVGEKSGIRMLSCAEFLGMVARGAQ
jgi:predicted nucleic acid-binding protein